MSLSAYLTPGTDNSFPAWHKQVMDSFEEVAILSTDSVPIDDVLRLIGRRMCELLGLSRCSVYLRREDGMFQGQVGYCAGGEAIDEGVSRLIAGTEGDKFTAEILRSVSPVVLQDATKDPRPLRSVMRIWGVRDMLGIPLVVDEEVIGIIYVDNQGAGHHYTDHDIQVAQAFASLASLILRKSWLYGQLVKHADEIERQRKVLDFSGAIQTDVNRAIVDGADADGVIEILAGRLGKPVILYDKDLNVSGWAAPASWGDRPAPGLQPTHRRAAWVRDMVQKLDSGVAIVVTPANPDFTHRGMFTRLTVKDEMLGYLEICEIGRPFGQVDSRALAHAAVAVALTMMVHRRNAAQQSHRLNELIAEIVQPHADPRVLKSSFEAADLPLTDRYGLLYFSFSADDEESTQVSPIERREALMSILSSKIADPDALSLVVGTSVGSADVVLYSVRTEDRGHAISEAAKAAMPSLTAMTGVQFAVVSEPYPDPVDLSGAVEDAHNLAEVITRTQAGPGVYELNELAILQLLHQRDGLAGAMRYARRMLRPLHAYDAAHKGSLIETLQAYVSAQMNMKAAAVALNVHENTIRYRLGRIRDISTIDPDRFDDLIRVRTALQLIGLEEHGPTETLAHMVIA